MTESRSQDVSPVAAPLQWRCLAFDSLSVHSLYRLLKLRSEVFVVEQACVFQDLDDADMGAMHLLGQASGPDGVPRLLAYARCLAAGVSYAQASIGRVVTSPSARGTGIGYALMQEAVRSVHNLWGPQPIRIGAQAHLQSFYRQHGFEPDGAIYVEDGIEHIEMLRQD